MSEDLPPTVRTRVSSTPFFTSGGLLEPRPFRDPDLTNEQALDAMLDVARVMERHALACRYELLAIGFADNHSMCRELDRQATHWANTFLAVRRLRYGG